MGILRIYSGHSTEQALTCEERQCLKGPAPNRRTKTEGGLRTNGYCRKSYPSKPLVSIVTVVLNGEDYLEEAIRSVVDQTYDNIEYIVVDGGSTDGTLGILKRYDDRIDYWVSEPDEGIYDAMNKGITFANGEWLYFLGCDDSLYTRNVISNLFLARSLSDVDVLYGNVLLKRSKKIYDGKFTKTKIMIQNICHQSIFCRKRVFSILGKFNPEYKPFADYEFNLRWFARKNIKHTYFREIIAIYDERGSSANCFSLLKGEEFKRDRGLLVRTHLGNCQYVLFMAITLLRAVVPKGPRSRLSPLVVGRLGAESKRGKC